MVLNWFSVQWCMTTTDKLVCRTCKSKHIVINFDVGKVCSHALKESINRYIINYVKRKTEEVVEDHIQYMLSVNYVFFIYSLEYLIVYLKN